MEPAPAAATQLPVAEVRRRRLFRVAWVVPLIAALVAGWLVYQRVRESGPEIRITFNNGDGLRAGQTPIKYRGVAVGEVSRIELTEDHKQVLVRARVQRSAMSLMRDGATFWVVRPQLGFGNVSGLGTVLSGPEIQVLPGKGEPRREFDGLDHAPAAMEQPGLRLILRAEHPRSLRGNSPVYYRGVEVGVVQKIDLAPNAASADVHVLVRSRFAPLVREGSVFWNVSGVNLKAGILKGVELEFESLRSLVTGGIEFATPSEKMARAKSGTVFFLHENAKKEWLSWTPKIQIGAEK
jgi:paraquat-inducible protein B